MGAINRPLSLRLAIFLGAIGTGCGGLLALLVGARQGYVEIAGLIGGIVGFGLGYQLGRTTHELNALARTEGFLRKGDKSLTIMSGVFVVAGTFLLIRNGWSPEVFLSTIFFLACTLYIWWRCWR